MQLFSIFDVGEQALTTIHNIFKCLIKITGIPRISYITCLAQPMRLLIVSERQHLVNLPFHITATGNPRHIPDIRTIHTNQVIIICIIRPRHLSRPMRNQRDLLPLQFSLCPMVWRIPNLLRTRRCRINLETGIEMGLAGEVGEYALSHGGTAYVAVANK